jgi:hypothetical protein
MAILPFIMPILEHEYRGAISMEIMNYSQTDARNSKINTVFPNRDTPYSLFRRFDGWCCGFHARKSDGPLNIMCNSPFQLFYGIFPCLMGGIFQEKYLVVGLHQNSKKVIRSLPARIRYCSYFYGYHGGRFENCTQFKTNTSLHDKRTEV